MDDITPAVTDGTVSEAGLDAAFAAASAEVESVDQPTDGGDGTVESPTTDATPVAPADDTPRFKVKLDGQELEVTQDELVAGYQRQSDYTRKTQAVAAREEELRIAEGVWARLQEDPAGTIEALNEFFADQLRETPLSAEEVRLAAAEQYIEQQRQATLDAEINTEMARLTEEYGAFDRTDLIQFAIDNQIGSLEAALTLQLRQLERAGGEAKRLAAKKAAPPVAGGSKATNSVAEPEGPLDSIEACLAAAYAEHGVERP